MRAGSFPVAIATGAKSIRIELPAIAAILADGAVGTTQARMSPIGLFSPNLDVLENVPHLHEHEKLAHESGA